MKRVTRDCIGAMGFFCSNLCGQQLAERLLRKKMEEIKKVVDDVSQKSGTDDSVVKKVLSRILRDEVKEETNNSK